MASIAIDCNKFAEISFLVARRRCEKYTHASVLASPSETGQRNGRTDEVADQCNRLHCIVAFAAGRERYADQYVKSICRLLCFVQVSTFKESEWP
jgi:hypothetical protein